MLSVMSTAVIIDVTSCLIFCLKCHVASALLKRYALYVQRYILF